MTEHVESADQGGQESVNSAASASSVNLPLGPPTSTLAGGPEAVRVSQTTSDFRTPGSNGMGQPAVRGREIVCVLSIVVLSDITIFRGTGFAGAALFFFVAPFLLVLASPAPAFSALVWGVAAMVWITAGRLIWQGSILAGLTGVLLLTAFAMTLVRQTPFLLELLGFASRAWVGGRDVVILYARWFRQHLRNYPQILSLHWILPVAALLIFGSLFIAANPDLARTVQEAISQILSRVDRWFAGFTPSFPEVLFCVVVGWYSSGALRPGKPHRVLAESGSATGDSEIKSTANRSANANNFAPFRNTLVAVSVLFAVYLVFEFQTLWFRTFPEGFHYSGYAHQGAAWLTVALALSTAVLSIVFRGAILMDPRLPQLRRWAWIWSVENFVLALAVYHRLWIYIEFNGMTRMRTVALFGITSVLIGFLLVLWKLAYDRSFLWLLRRHLLTVALAGYVYVILPVDWLVYSYNVRRILNGDVAPAVQITEHDVSPEGMLTLPPLLQSSDPIIRDGILSLLESQKLTKWQSPNRRIGWTSHQLVHGLLERRLEVLPVVAVDSESSTQREAAWQRFREYAYQWY